jgi:hypothetical protein
MEHMEQCLDEKTEAGPMGPVARFNRLGSGAQHRADQGTFGAV